MTFSTTAHAAWEARQLADHLDGPDALESPVKVTDYGITYEGRFVSALRALEIIEEDARVAGYEPKDLPEYREIEEGVEA